MPYHKDAEKESHEQFFFIKDGFLPFGLSMSGFVPFEAARCQNGFPENIFETVLTPRFRRSGRLWRRWPYVVYIFSPDGVLKCQMGGSRSTPFIFFIDMPRSFFSALRVVKVIKISSLSGRCSNFGVIFKMYCSSNSFHAEEVVSTSVYYNKEKRIFAYIPVFFAAWGATI